MLTHNVLESADQAVSYFSAGEYYEASLPGQWYGKAAANLKLTGEVEKQHFESLCRNRNPFTGQRITAKDAHNRRVGYDLTWSIPKSAAILFAVGGDERILTASKQALLRVLEEVEGMMQARIRKKGQPDFDRTTANLAAAIYTHFLARPVNGWADMFVHFHTVILNMCHDTESGKWKAGQFGLILENAEYLQELFDSFLSQGLAEIGYSTERRGKKIEIKAVPEEIVRRFSRRTEEIEDVAEAEGITDPEKKARLSLSTRKNKKDSLVGEDLKKQWRQTLTDEEFEALQRVVAAAKMGPVVPDHPTAEELIEYAGRHVFERASVVSEDTLILAALKTGSGLVSPEALKKAIQKSDLIREEANGKTWVTTPTVLREEFENIGFVKAGRGALMPIDIDPELADHEKLSDEQWNAVRHILKSPDWVTAIAGAPGTGKTTLMQVAIERIQATGLRVFTCAPSADASRGVLRDEGFGDADTLHKLLHDSKLQDDLAGQVVWVDEAGLVGAAQMHQLFSFANEKGFRIVLSGDTGQHSPVPRGDALRLLESHAGLRAARVRTIRRQKSDGYRAAVTKISNGDVAEGFHKLDELGFIQEFGNADRHEALAKSYVSAIGSGQSCLVVAPTHAEGTRVTVGIREELRRAGRLGTVDRTFRRLKNLSLTEAERGRHQNYAVGMTIEFNADLPGKKILRGDRVAVTSVSEKDIEVLVRGKATQLPLEQASKFTVYEEDRLRLAAGDHIRITRNGAAVGGQRLSNGALYKIKEFTKKGEIVLTNQMVLPVDFAHLAHGYCVSSLASQGKTVDHVLIAQSAESLGKASSREQFNVSVSRGKHAVTIFTDDKLRLLEAVSRSSARKSAHDLLSASRRETLLRQFHRRRQILRIESLKQEISVSAHVENSPVSPEPESTTTEIEL